MSSLADRTIAALRVTQDELEAVASRLTDDKLLRPSGAAQWNVAQVEAVAGFLEHSGPVVEALEALTPGQREGLTMTVGFLPYPLSVATVAGMRLNEVALHSWDVRVALDPATR